MLLSRRSAFTLAAVTLLPTPFGARPQTMADRGGLRFGLNLIDVGFGLGHLDVICGVQRIAETRSETKCTGAAI